MFETRKGLVDGAGRRRLDRRTMTILSYGYFIFFIFSSQHRTNQAELKDRHAKVTEALGVIVKKKKIVLVFFRCKVEKEMRIITNRSNNHHHRRSDGRSG